MNVQARSGSGATGTASGTRKSGRPAVAVLNREAITKAALALIDAKGYDAMTMKSLATELGVAASALYNHVSSKQDLWIPLQEELMAKLDTSVFQRLPLRSAMAAWARNYRDVLAEHPRVIAGIATLPVKDSPRTLAQYEAVTSALERGGIPAVRVVSVLVAFESFIFGSALDVSAPADIFDSGADAAQYPHFAAAVTQRAALPADPTEDAFELGLSALLNVLPS
ncbi:TetR/AcrR family transcriptional regulator [Galactobacter sp.]|uniref:TetR/AcrR family transcriptional regulator n=1 Tax=Galactobacter sp. TaxID=2676125 RepID=UPI0025C36DCC|nr:TetR/AcrR family transcriptional regulator [Galactobacter sp.]